MTTGQERKKKKPCKDAVHTKIVDGSTARPIIQSVNVLFTYGRSMSQDDKIGKATDKTLQYHTKNYRGTWGRYELVSVVVFTIHPDVKGHI